VSGTAHVGRAGEERGSAGTRDLEVIACDRCGRSFATDDGPAMIAAIKGPCPDCGGRFELRTKRR
jgi:hypothetical protein